MLNVRAPEMHDVYIDYAVKVLLFARKCNGAASKLKQGKIILNV